MKLIKKLDEWVINNLISSDQKDKIINYETNKKEADSKILFGFMIMGGFAIAIGLISLIAYNWIELGKYTKLLGGLVVLIGLMAGYLRFKSSGSNGIAETFLMLFYLGCLGYIGLVGQVYNLYSMPHHGFLFWGIITAPLLFLTARSFIPFIWFINFFACSFMELVSCKMFLELMETLTNSVIPPLIILMSLLFQFLIYRGGKLLFKNYSHINKAFSIYMVISMMCTVWNIDIIGAIGLDGYLYNYNTESSFNYWFYGMALVMIVGAWLLVPRDNSIFAKSLLIAVYSFFAINMFFYPLNGFWFAIFDIVIMSMIAIYAALNDRGAMFKSFMALIAIRIVIIYITAFDGLLETGLWLIGTGVVITGGIIVWNKYKIHLEKVLKEYLQ